MNYMDKKSEIVSIHKEIINLFEYSKRREDLHNSIYIPFYFQIWPLVKLSNQVTYHSMAMATFLYPLHTVCSVAKGYFSDLGNQFETMFMGCT